MPETIIDGKYSTYQPPQFTDETRLDKIRQLLPVVKANFQHAFDTNHFPGLTYGLVVDGELFDSHSFGSINLERQLPATSQSLFRIASMTKSFTAMAIVRLRDDSKLRLDDPVTQYIPEFNRTDFLTDDGPIVTIRHLLTQDTGMPEDDPWADRQLAIDDTEFLTMLQKGISLSNPPGTIWEYTNLAYAMLGRIVTVVSQMPYQKYIEQEILLPLGMKNTVWEYDEIPPDHLAHGYRWESERYSEESLLHDGTYGAMGGLISSIEDFSKYVSYHLQAWPPRDGAEDGPLRRSSLREMHHPSNFIGLKTGSDESKAIFTAAYCYGLVWTKTSDGIVSINHSGGLPGFGSNWMILPDYGIGIVSFSNCTYAALDGLNSMSLNRLVELGNLEVRKLPLSTYLAKRKEQLIDVLIEKHWDLPKAKLEEIFAENIFLDHSLELRKKQSDDLLHEIGQIHTITELFPKNQLRGFCIINAEHALLHLNFSLSPENPPLIQQYTLKKLSK